MRISLYPKLVTQLYDVKTVAVNSQVRQFYSRIAEVNPKIYEISSKTKQSSELVAFTN